MRFKVGDYVQMRDELFSPYQGFVGLVIGARPNEEHMAVDRYLITFGGASVIEVWDGQLDSVVHDRNWIPGHAA